MSQRCLDENAVAALMQGALLAEEEAEADRHLDQCRRCNLVLATIAGACADGADEPPPERINDRYLLLEVLGVGGMGIVYAAHDRELDRRIALKLLHSTDQGAQRIRQEAHAMARLSSPHVVAVYDVGSVAGRLYIAMELVRGVTLKEWLSARKRSWPEILEVFAQAGHGLAAAHDSGLVHRDFKPENVMVSEAGRAQVTDFGLARSLDHAGREIAGTPAYMAPEQRAGRALDGRSDQFTFCLVLWEALFAERPGAARQKERGLQRILRRGLSIDPADRHPSMGALLHALALEQRPSWQRHRPLWALLGSLLLAGLALFGQRRFAADARQVCRGGGAKLAAVWNAGKQARLHTAFQASQLAYAESAWTATVRGLDGFGARWVAQHQEACEATQVRREQSEERLDRRMECLARQLREADELVALLLVADKKLVERAPDAVSFLPNPAVCERSGPPTHADPVTLTRARALRDAGQYPPALALAESAAADASRAHDPPAEAETRLLVSDLEDDLGRYPDAEKSALAAESAAIAGRDDDAAASAWIRLTRLAGVRRLSFDDGKRYAALAQAAVGRLGGAPDQQAELKTAEGLMAERTGHAEEALLPLKEAVQLSERWRGADQLVTTRMRGNLAVALAAAGHREEALAEGRRVVALFERQLGAEHPTTAGNLKNVGTTLYEMGRYQEAATTLERALAVLQTSLGPRHPKTAATMMALGNALEMLDRVDEAVALHERALAIYQEALGADHPMTAASWDTLCASYTTAARYSEALTACRKAEALGAPEAVVQLHLGDLFEAQKQNARALGFYQRALAADEKSIGLDHSDAAFSLSSVGRGYVVAGQTDKGLPLLERALALAAPTAASPQDPLLLGDTELALFRGLGDTPRGRALKKAAESHYAEAGPRGEKRRRQMRGLLGGPLLR